MTEKHWVKLWVECVSDFKVRRVPFHLRWCFPALLCLAKKSTREGYIEISPGEPYKEDELAHWCGCEIRDILDACNALVTVGILEDDDGVLRFSKWEKRQYSGTLARVKKCRTKKISEAMKPDCNASVTECNVREEVEVEVDKNKDLRPSADGPPVFSPQDMADLWNQCVAHYATKGEVKIPKVKWMTKGRDDKCRARIKGCHLNKELWMRILNTIHKDDWLSGRNPGKGHEKWVADFDYVISKDTNIARILEKNID